MNTVTINGHSIKVPSWNEWTRDQLLAISEAASETATIPEFCLKVFFILTGLKVITRREVIVNGERCYHIRYGKKNVHPIGEKDLTALTVSIHDNLFAKVYRKGQEIDVFDSKLYENKLPGFSHKHTYYYGPDKGLTNLIFEEYIYSETYFDRYSRTKDPVHLNKLIAVLYRPEDKEIDESSPDFDGDKRQQFNANLIDQHAQTLASLPDKYKTAIFFYYTGCRWFLKQQFPEIYKEAAASNVDVFQDFIKLTSILSGSSINNDKLRKTMLYDVLSDLNTKKEQHKEQLKKQNKHGV